jgi:hypothetical protein
MLAALAGISQSETPAIERTLTMLKPAQRLRGAQNLGVHNRSTRPAREPATENGAHGARRQNGPS